MRKPVVSVVMPVRNAERYLREAVESVLAQTFRDFELMVVDDGSTDGSAEVVRSFRDERVRLLPNEGEPYLAGALTYGCRQARGGLIARMDADDICLPERLARQVEFMRSNPEVGVVGSNVEWTDEQGRSATAKAWRRPESHEAICAELFLRCPFCHPTVMMRREVLARLGWYETSLLKGREQYSAEDLDLWRRGAGVTMLRNLPDVLLRYRIHGQGISQASEVRSNHLENVAMVVSELCREDSGAAPNLSTAAALYSEDLAGNVDRSLALGILANVHRRGRGTIGRADERQAHEALCLARAESLIAGEGRQRAWRYFCLLCVTAPRLSLKLAPRIVCRLIR